MRKHKKNAIDRKRVASNENTKNGGDRECSMTRKPGERAFGCLHQGETQIEQKKHIQALMKERIKRGIEGGKNGVDGGGG